MCDLAYDLLAGQVRAVALADRQAELTAAVLRGVAGDYTPIDPAERLAAFDRALAGDGDTTESDTAADQWAQAWMTQTVQLEEAA